MAEYTERLQILLSPEQHAFLADLARRRRQSAGELVREAVFAAYRPSSNLRALQALRTLLSLRDGASSASAGSGDEADAIGAGEGAERIRRALGAESIRRAPGADLAS